MSILESLISPMSLSEFVDKYYLKQPMASPFKAKAFEGVFSWPLLTEILEADYNDCWLAENGKLHENSELNTGRLTIEQATKSFKDGKTILVRHSEKVHPQIQTIADDFFNLFGLPVDVQLYATPAQHEGFNWHYDMEDVFVIQTVGEKEFFLKPNTVNPYPLFMPKNLEFHKEKNKTEIRCWLKAGDWLYIPKGYWHKARAISDSFHISVGVLNNIPQYLLKDLTASLNLQP